MAKDSNDKNGQRDKKKHQSRDKWYKTRSCLLPVALLPVLVRVEARIRPSLRIADVTLGSLALRLLSLALGSGTCTSGEPLRAVEAPLRLLDATTTLRALARLSNTSTHILHVRSIRLVSSLGRTSATLAERRTRRGDRRLTKSHKSLHALTAATIQLLAIVV